MDGNFHKRAQDLLTQAEKKTKGKRFKFPVGFIARWTTSKEDRQEEARELIS